MRLLAAVLICGNVLCADDLLYRSAAAKLDRIESGKTEPGEVVVFTPPEVNAYARGKALQYDGIRNPKVELGIGTASGFALINIAKLRTNGAANNPLIGALLEGERPVRVSVSMESANGQCTFHLRSVEISGLTLQGRMLDFLLSSVFLPMFPEAKIGEPFDLREPIDHLEMRPDGLRAVMKKK